jgi:hypothetical protein
MLMKQCRMLIAVLLTHGAGALRAGEVALLDAETAWRANLTVAPELGKEARDAIPVLKAAAQQGDADVKSAAEEILKAIEASVAEK